VIDGLICGRGRAGKFGATAVNNCLFVDAALYRFRARFAVVAIWPN